MIIYRHGFIFGRHNLHDIFKMEAATNTIATYICTDDYTDMTKGNEDYSELQLGLHCNSLSVHHRDMAYMVHGHMERY